MPISFVDGVRFKRRLPAIPRVRNGGVYIALAGNFPREVIYITSIISVIGTIGAVASIISLVLDWYERKEK